MFVMKRDRRIEKYPMTWDNVGYSETPWKTGYWKGVLDAVRIQNECRTTPSTMQPPLLTLDFAGRRESNSAKKSDCDAYPD